MIKKDKLLSDLDRVEKLANGTKFRRFMHSPIKYISSFLYRKIIYPKNKKEWVTDASLFWGNKMRIALPAGTDIFLTGGKTHDSEIRLARFLITHLEEGDRFLDIGAHYGFFTLLANELIGEKGMIFCFEPTEKTFSKLHFNVGAITSIRANQVAVSKQEGSIQFYEFPNLYSEYNSTQLEQFSSSAWFENEKPNVIEVEATTLNKIMSENNFIPQIIKVDVEGAELDVVEGGKDFLHEYNPFLILEIWGGTKANENHEKVVTELAQLGYQSFSISNSGDLILLENVSQYFIENQLDSDNIVFRKGVREKS